ncbi:MAG TPA: outer membrane protein assembly factor BamE [Sedimentisphaerales bacterium]|jgi:outer membrane protein assembly factor BamE (lipoprotein component of BamABCDE complex)|nr:outer membrane protein assembly factor BamE [Sedimentisphaerales bacterium]HNU28231.1 outer membrane protein assembly factor BamE [Sedimentisphaerales bacterium]
MGNKAKSNLIIALLVPVGCVVIGISLLGYWSVHSHAVPPDKLERLHQGMTKEEVRALLGDPASETTHEEGHETWVYGHRWKWYFLTIRFSSENKLVEYVHDD